MILGNNFIKYNYYNYILIFLLYIIFNYKYNSIYSITEEIFFFITLQVMLIENLLAYLI